MTTWTWVRSLVDKSFIFILFGPLLRTWNLDTSIEFHMLFIKCSDGNSLDKKITIWGLNSNFIDGFFFKAYSWIWEKSIKDATFIFVNQLHKLHSTQYHGHLVHAVWLKSGVGFSLWSNFSWHSCPHKLYNLVVYIFWGNIYTLLTSVSLYYPGHLSLAHTQRCTKKELGLLNLVVGISKA